MSGFGTWLNIQGVVVVAVAFVLAYFVAPWIVKVLLRRRFLARVRDSGCVCLTFDDGPDPSSTPEILRTLAQAGARATFFVLGKNARAHPDLMRAIAAGGHEIGEHGYAHLPALSTDPVRLIRDLARSRAALRPFSNLESGLFRAPFGKVELTLLLCVLATGRRFVFWNVDPRDYEETSPGDLAAAVERPLAPGSVVLLHDGREGPRRSPACVTAQALPAILKACAQRGLRIATVGEALRGR
jgi:peptidoglycan/xylan/chitin deacetylase (PgdA/CDA1 family)